MARERGHVDRFSWPSDWASGRPRSGEPGHFLKNPLNFVEINLQSGLLSQFFFKKAHEL
jgi:hypothetical protein